MKQRRDCSTGEGREEKEQSRDYRAQKGTKGREHRKDCRAEEGTEEIFLGRRGNRGGTEGQEREHGGG